MLRPDGRTCNEKPGEKSETGEPIPHRLCRHQYRGDWQSGLFPCPSQVGQAWNRLHRQNGPPVEKQRLQPFQPPDWNGQSYPSEYVSDMHWRFRRQTSPFDEVWLMRIKQIF